jgi:hypothetical protein
MLLNNSLIAIVLVATPSFGQLSTLQESIMRSCPLNQKSCNMLLTSLAPIEPLRSIDAPTPRQEMLFHWNQCRKNLARWNATQPTHQEALELRNKIDWFVQQPDSASNGEYPLLSTQRSLEDFLRLVSKTSLKSHDAKTIKSLMKLDGYLSKMTITVPLPKLMVEK